MPTNFSALDQNLPRFTGEETTERKVQVIQDYLYQLLEALRYAMNNLDTRNFNQIEWDKFLDGYGSGLTDPIYKQLSDAEGNLTKLEVTAKDCIGCQSCESRCPFGVKIADRMAKAAALLDA